MSAAPIPAETPILAWHCLASDRLLAHDGRRLVVQAGETYTVDGPLVLCKRGLHGSVRALDALAYAPGPIVCRTAHWGDVLQEADKCCSTHRQVLWLADATTLLHTFACDMAEQALLRERATGREPDQRAWAVIAAKRAWLRGGATDKQLDAALAAAWDAARAAAWAAAWDAQNALLEARFLALGEASR